ncbi:RNA polymerase sigma-70 factor (ECF subfamily) [Arcticibacter tournemirensis]|uniref:Sigma-70 family RNA polymerase sigma factor n=1 Tax=Arcticibacter tournemirensis TaxID=699437 RepID=A0A5M9GYH3_9SPHI|nr:sigma-70 family RNA polymerase sigma factor [Arcticibacter tournemirensis]KAA8479733.1 sigma-70 family RNA polymerase sigma factor [Arcticibacter tournemirensis]TQM50238.1 RNA polymerase sigma-70 factor (ECF subfamily) [Arcticibacter tournemirensis]
MGEAELHQLIAGCLKQDRKDQKVLYKAFYGFAMSICLRYAGNRYEAAEIMNNGFFKIFTHLDKYSHDKPFKAWMGKIMTNTAIDYYRSNLKMANTDGLEKAEDIGHDDFPDKKLRYDDLLAMVQQLPNAYRTVFNLYAIEGYSHEEIGEMLGISAGTSKSNLFKARDKLKRMVLQADSIGGNASGDSYTTIVAINPINLSVTFFNNGIFK